jgi:hypothetical protein
MFLQFDDFALLSHAGALWHSGGDAGKFASGEREFEAKDAASEEAARFEEKQAKCVASGEIRGGGNACVKEWHCS